MQMLERDEHGTSMRHAGEVEGVTPYPDWKPPDPCINKHGKTFYLELDNVNWTNQPHTPPGADGPTEHITFAPYYLFTWQYLHWYLDYMQYEWYVQNTNMARVKSAKFQINIIGHRLPFTTNNEASSVANSQVDQQLDVFRAVEKRWPFDVFENAQDGNSQVKSRELFALTQRLYGNGEGDDVPATAGYRRYYWRPGFISNTNISRGNPEPNLLRYPSMAEFKYCDADLRVFRGPIVEVDFVPTSGYLNLNRSKMPPAYFPNIYRAVFSTNAIYDSNDKDDTIVRVDSGQAKQTLHYEYRFNRTVLSSLPPQIGLDQGAISGSDAEDNAARSYFVAGDLEGPTFTQRHSAKFPSYQSLMLGVRPQMNGSDYQRGILQIEVKTEIEIEYQLYWASSWNCLLYTSPSPRDS